METKDHSQWLVVPQRETWLVCAFHAGQGDVSREMSELCSHLKQSYRPYVGVAAPLGETGRFHGPGVLFPAPPSGHCARRQDFRSTCTATSPSARTGVTSSGPRPTS